MESNSMYSIHLGDPCFLIPHPPVLLSHPYSNWIIMFPITEKEMSRIEFTLDDTTTFSTLLTVPIYSAHLLCCATCHNGGTICTPV